MNLLNRILQLLLVISLLTGCFNKKETAPTDQSIDKNKITAADLKVDRDGLSIAKATLKTVHGNIVFKFYPKQAPNTVTRIIELIQQGFYDGLIFHRVVPNFVIQTGDPTGTGTQGSGKKLKAEFNSIQHIKGTVAMARAQDKDSADSQFYIALTTLPHLDKKYTVFGQVSNGLEILNKITEGDKILSLSLEL